MAPRYPESLEVLLGPECDTAVATRAGCEKNSFAEGDFPLLRLSRSFCRLLSDARCRQVTRSQAAWAAIQC